MWLEKNIFLSPPYPFPQIRNIPQGISLSLSLVLRDVSSLSYILSPLQNPVHGWNRWDVSSLSYILSPFQNPVHGWNRYFQGFLAGVLLFPVPAPSYFHQNIVPPEPCSAFGYWNLLCFRGVIMNSRFEGLVWVALKLFLMIRKRQIGWYSYWQLDDDICFSLCSALTSKHSVSSS